MINLQDLKQTVPALFQTEKLSKLSDRYTMVPYNDLLPSKPIVAVPDNNVIALVPIHA